MRWKRARRSQNVEDRRAAGPRRGRGRAGGLSIGLALVALIGSYFLGFDPTPVLVLMQGELASAPPRHGASAPAPIDDEASDFVRAILGDTEDTWKALFEQGGAQYRAPRLVLFRGRVDSACGGATSATGPFYCPADQQAYLDLVFFDDMERRLGGGGDFAEAYVIAHEIGHHVQTLLGVSARIHEMRRAGGVVEGADGPLVRQELQADCYAGIWAHHAEKRLQWLEPGDVEEALATATAIGDDRLQRRSSGTVVPDSFTHGTSAQRVQWFRTGFESGEVGSCDTFARGALSGG